MPTTVTEWIISVLAAGGDCERSRCVDDLGNCVNGVGSERH